MTGVDTLNPYQRLCSDICLILKRGQRMSLVYLLLVHVPEYDKANDPMVHIDKKYHADYPLVILK